MRTTNIIILLFCLISPTWVAAQTNYLPGYFVTANSDTVEGLIENRGNVKMSRFIVYKANAGSDPVRVYPENTRSVIIGDKNVLEVYTITEGSRQVHAFFEKIIDGRLSLYRYDGKRYFIKKGDEPIREITLSREVPDQLPHINKDDLGFGPTSRLQTMYKGLGVLRVATRDCPSFSEQFLIDQYATSTVDYTAIVTKYNQCFPEKQVVIESIRIPAHINFGIQGSLNSTQQNFANAEGMTDASFALRFSGAGGLFFSLFHPRFGDNVRLVLEPAYGKYNGYSFFKSGQTVNDLYIRYSYVRVPLLLRYYHKRFFFDGGLSNFFVVNQNQTWRQEISLNNVVATSDRSDYKIKSSFTGVAVGIGRTLEMGGRDVHTSVRFTNIFRSSSAQRNQPSIQWFDLNLAFQLNK